MRMAFEEFGDPLLLILYVKYMFSNWNAVSSLLVIDAFVLNRAFAQLLIQTAYTLFNVRKYYYFLR